MPWRVRLDRLMAQSDLRKRAQAYLMSAERILMQVKDRPNRT